MSITFDEDAQSLLDQIGMPNHLATRIISMGHRHLLTPTAQSQTLPDITQIPCISFDILCDTLERYYSEIKEAITQCGYHFAERQLIDHIATACNQSEEGIALQHQILDITLQKKPTHPKKARERYQKGESLICQLAEGPLGLRPTALQVETSPPAKTKTHDGSSRAPMMQAVADLSDITPTLRAHNDNAPPTPVIHTAEAEHSKPKAPDIERE